MVNKKNVELLIGSLIVRNERGILGLGKDAILKEIAKAHITPIHKKGLFEYLKDAEDNRDVLSQILKDYKNNVVQSYNYYKQVAMFEKVSYEQFKKDFTNALKNNESYNVTDEKQIKKFYEAIQLPKRSTRGSAGYDFFTPIDFSLAPGETILIPTGIRCCMLENWVLKIYPRSGLGFKFRLQLNNTVGIIDSDYYNSDNEGHILVKITNDSHEDKIVEVRAGKGFAQGIFIEYGITFDDDADGVRNGGFGSTDA